MEIRYIWPKRQKLKEIGLVTDKNTEYNWICKLLDII